MAANNPRPRQRQTTFQIIKPLFDTEFNTQYPIFEDWTLERMPRTFNAKRIIRDDYKMSRGWLCESQNTNVRFRCTKCIKAGAVEKDATWSSAYTIVLFRGLLLPDNR